MLGGTSLGGSSDWGRGSPGQRVSAVGQLGYTSDVAVSVEAQRQVVCPGCGDIRWVAAWTARGVARGKQPALCTSCRYPPRPFSEEEQVALWRWWLDCYSDEEVAELALGLGVTGAKAANVAWWRAMLRCNPPQTLRRVGVVEWPVAPAQ
jgi:hypothetical protein